MNENFVAWQQDICPLRISTSLIKIYRHQNTQRIGTSVDPYSIIQYTDVHEKTFTTYNNK